MESIGNLAEVQYYGKPGILTPMWIQTVPANTVAGQVHAICDICTPPLTLEPLISDVCIEKLLRSSKYNLHPHLMRWAWHPWIIKTTFPGNSFKIQQAGCCLFSILAPSSGGTLTLPHYNEVILTGCPESINQSIYPLQLHWSTLAAAPSTRKH